MLQKSNALADQIHTDNDIAASIPLCQHSRRSNQPKEEKESQRGNGRLEKQNKFMAHGIEMRPYAIFLFPY